MQKILKLIFLVSSMVPMGISAQECTNNLCTDDHEMCVTEETDSEIFRRKIKCLHAGTLRVCGLSTLATLNVTGNETVGGNLAVAGNETVQGNLTVNGVVITSPTGGPASFQYGYLFNDNAQTVNGTYPAINSIVTFVGSANVTSGFAPSGSGLIINNAGIYTVSFSVTVAAGAVSTFSFVLAYNAGGTLTIIPGTEYGVSTGSSVPEVMITGQATLSVTAGQVLTLVNTGPTPTVLGGFTNASIMIEKIA